MSEFAVVKKLPPNKTVVFRTPFEGEDVLVRTGCYSEISSFFQCVLHSCSNTIKEKRRMKLVHRFQESLLAKKDRESWEKIEDAVTAFKEKISDIILNCYRFFKNDPTARGNATHKVIKNLVGEDEKLFECYKLIIDLIPLTEGFEEKILSDAYDDSNKHTISILTEKIIKNANSYIKNKKEVKSLSKQKSKRICELVCNFVTTVLKEAEEEAFKSFVAESKNLVRDIDSCIISSISKQFNCDIYIINAENRMPYLSPQTVDNLKGRKSIMLLCINKDEYEILGKLLPGNSIQREFDQSDPIIRKINTFLVNPEKVFKECNDLVKYLPKEYQNTDSEEDSEESSEENSEEESEESSEEEDSD
jgi:ribosomal protein S17E